MSRAEKNNTSPPDWKDIVKHKWEEIQYVQGANDEDLKLFTEKEKQN